MLTRLDGVRSYKRLFLTLLRGGRSPLIITITLDLVLLVRVLVSDFDRLLTRGLTFTVAVLRVFETAARGGHHAATLIRLLAIVITAC